MKIDICDDEVNILEDLTSQEKKWEQSFQGQLLLC